MVHFESHIYLSSYDTTQGTYVWDYPNSIQAWYHFLPFLNALWELIVKILPHGRHEPVYRTLSIPWLGMTCERHDWRWPMNVSGQTSAAMESTFYTWYILVSAPEWPNFYFILYSMYTQIILCTGSYIILKKIISFIYTYAFDLLHWYWGNCNRWIVPLCQMIHPERDSSIVQWQTTMMNKCWYMCLILEMYHQLILCTYL